MAVSDVGRVLATDLSHGLSPQEAAARLASDGRNELRRKDATPPLAILAAQFRSVVVVVLIVAAIVSAAVGDVIESGAILAIVVLNAILGFVQEYRAERAIAALLDRASSGETPLQRKLDQVARRLLVACLVIVTLVFALGVMRAIPPLEMFLAAVSLAVAAVPASLPAVVTIALALGVQRMARRAALVRRLPAVETLGSTDVICTDKTGTLTLGGMTVRRVVSASGVYTVTGEGYATEGDIVAADGSRATSVEGIFRTAPITLARTAVWTVIGALPFLVLEATKIVTRRRG